MNRYLRAIIDGWRESRGQPTSIASQPPVARRSFHGAQFTNLTATWSTQSLSTDAELRTQLPALRARSRDLANNNDYMRHFLHLVQANVVGHRGFTLQMRALDPSGKPDKAANLAIEKAVTIWGKRGTCDVTGKLSFAALKRLVVRTVARDGEALVRKVRDRKLNIFGFALQVLAIDRLDIALNGPAANGNVIRMGVEIDSYGRAAAYHLRTQHPGDGVYIAGNGSRYERVPASDILHIFIQEDPEQTRGIPWAVSAMTRLNHLGAFDEAAVIAARIGASKMGFYKQVEGSPNAGLPTPKTNGEYVTEASPGEFSVLPEGWDFTPFNPDYPHANYGPFIKACLRGISAGLAVSYHSLASDLEGANYSSLRAGSLEERDQWMVLQGWFADALLDDIFPDLLRMSLLMGAIVLPNGTALPANKFDKFNAPQWQGRRWPWVDPSKDITAAVTAVDNKLSSRTKVLAEQGEDFEDTAEQLKHEEDLFKELGLNSKQPAAAGFSSPAKPDDNPKEPSDEPEDD